MGRLLAFVIVVVAALAVAGPAQAAAPTNTVLPSITVPPHSPANPVEGDVLTASTGTWSGDEPITYSYQWYRCTSTGCVARSGATSSTYVPVWSATASQSDINKTMQVTVRATNSFGFATANSARTLGVRGAPPKNTIRPTTSGWPYVGQILSSTLGTWNDSPHNLTINFSRQWQRCLASSGCSAPSDWSSITGATSQNYTVTTAVVDHKVRLRVSGTTTFNSAYAYSDPTAVVANPPSPPVNTAAPVVSGVHEVGQTLTTSTGAWAPDAPTAFTYAWQRCDYVAQQCQDVAGETEATYVFGSSDLSYKIRSRVTADNGGGVSTAYSEIKPVLTASPALIGKGNVAEALSTEEGTWTNEPSSIRYQWERCNGTGTNCTPISGATAATYTASPADLGHALRGVVTASNAFGDGAPAYTRTLAILKPIEELVRDYSPKLFFDKSEEWRPLDVGLFLSEIFPEYEDATHHRICKKEPGEYTTWCSELTGVDALFVADGRSYDIQDRAWIEIRHEGLNGYASPRAGCVWTNNHGQTVRDCSSGSESAIYYAYGQDRAGYRYLNYWFFYRFNRTRYAGLGDHEGDWESVTVVLDPVDAASPDFVRAIYEQHGQRNWFGVASPSVTHPYVYVASGTHASYVDACVEDWAGPCPSPVPEAPLESDHGGDYPWGGNECSTCLLSLPLDSWTVWKGRWGVNWDSDEIGTDSPTSVGVGHDSFTCLPDYFEPRCTRPDDFRTFQAASKRTRAITEADRDLPPACRPWFGGGVVALVCDPEKVIRARRTRGLPSTFRASVAGRRALVAPGVAQVVGRLLAPSSVVRVEGRLQPKTKLAFAIWHKRRIYHAVATARQYFSGRRTTVEIATRNGDLILRVHVGRSVKLLPARITPFGAAGP